MAWRNLSGEMRLSAAQNFSQLLHFSKRQRKEEDVRASLSLSDGIPSELQSHIRRWHFRPGQHCGLGRGPDPYPPTVLCLKMRETLLYYFFRENKHYFDGKKATPPWMSIDLVTE